MRLFFTADWHCGHKNILEYSNRPFKSVEDMHKHFVKRYNHIVKESDVCYFLGDMGCCSTIEIKDILSRLNGTKILILGNHDRWGTSTYYNCGFSAILESATLKLGKEVVELRHIPTRSLSEFMRLAWTYFKKHYKKGTLKYFSNRMKNEWSRYSPPKNHWTLSAHVHTAWLTKGKNINVGVDVWDYSPVSAEQILKIIREKKG